MGIGLALARSLVEMHGGQVEAHSGGPGRGSEFVVRLPLAAAPSQDERIEGEATVAWSRPHIGYWSSTTIGTSATVSSCFCS